MGPFTPLKFHIAWMTDQLVSFIGPIKDFAFMICFYIELASGVNCKKIKTKKFSTPLSNKKKQNFSFLHRLY